MKRSSEKKHWDDFWAASGRLQDVYDTDERIVDNLDKVVDVRGLRVLEVGAGTGRDADHIAAKGGVVCALDYSEESLALMGRTAREAMAIVCGDALRLPFADGSFDVVFHQGLLEHFRDPGPMLDENVRVLKTGGTLLVDVPQRFHYYTVLKHLLIAAGKWFAGWETEFSVRELTRLIESRGMRVVVVYGHNLYPPVWYRGLRRILLKAGVRLPMYPETAALKRARLGARSLVPHGLYVNTAMVIGCIATKE